jgi:hypothetical protein
VPSLAGNAELNTQAPTIPAQKDLTMAQKAAVKGEVYRVLNPMFKVRSAYSKLEKDSLAIQSLT